MDVQIEGAIMADSQTMSNRAGSDSLRVVTFNLWGWRGDWTARRELIIDGLQRLQPDLVAFQEAVKTDEYDPVVDLLGTAYQVIHQSDREADGSGALIASRWPIGATHELDLHVTPRTADFACTTLVADVQAPEPFGPLLFVNHLPNWQLAFEYERELQGVIAARFVEDHVGDQSQHVIVAGDFDAGPEAASMRFWTGRQSLDGLSVCYRDAWESIHAGDPGHTFTPDNPLVADWDWPFRRIDHILVRCGLHGGPTLRIQSCTRIFDEPFSGVWASDHFGLVADLTVPPRR